MAIQPIDLQTLFTQMDKVGKAQMAQREGLAIQQAIQGAQLQRRIDEQMQAVNETQNTGDDGTEKVKDRGAQAQDNEKKNKGEEQDVDNSQEDENQTFIIHDPRLGRNIDISL